MKLTARKEKKIFLPDDEDQAYVIIQYLKPGVRELLEQQSNTVTAQEGDDGDFGAKVEFNIIKKRKLFYEKVIMSWHGFFASNGKPSKLTLANVEKFAEEDDKFYPWLQEESDKFNDEVDAEKEQEEGN